jgi:hypothetical protein
MPFEFTTLGRLAVIGNRSGVANILGISFSGFFAWWLWRTIHLFKLPRLEKKVPVAVDWTLDLCCAGLCLRHVESLVALWRISPKERTGRSDPEGGVPSRAVGAADRGQGAVTFRWPLGISEWCWSVGAGFRRERRFKW